MAINESRVRQEVLKFAKSYVGTKESPPRSNKVEFSDWWGFHAAWCQMFVNYIIYYSMGKQCVPRSLPSQGQHSDKGTAYTPWAVDWFKRNNLYSSRTETPKPGDIIYFDWQGGRPNSVDHVGFVVKANSNGTVTTIEGNTGSGNWSNGGAVMECTRYLNTIACYGDLPIKLLDPDYIIDIKPQLEHSAAISAPKKVANPGRYPKWNGTYYRNGYFGKDLMAWEKKMQQRGWSITADGRYTDYEAKLVRWFQSEKQLEVDGIIGPLTWNAAWELEVT